MRAPQAMVATSQPLASQVGLEILKRGGNAADAAIAVAAVLNVTEPNMTGIGGDAFAMVYSAKTKKLEALNASGRAPRALNLEYFTLAQDRADADDRHADDHRPGGVRRLGHAAREARDDEAGGSAGAGDRLCRERLSRGREDLRGLGAGGRASSNSRPRPRPPISSTAGRRRPGRSSCRRTWRARSARSRAAAATPTTAARSRARSWTTARRTAASSRWRTSPPTSRPGSSRSRRRIAATRSTSCRRTTRG